MMTTPLTKISVGISSCLLGETVRYDGGHRENAYITNELGQIFDFVPFCPEMAIGLGVPRDPLQLVNVQNGIRCLGIKDRHIDVTDQLVNYANSEKSHHAQLSGYVFKRGSPSCGIKSVKTFNIDNKNPNTFSATGMGIYARQLSLNHPLLPITDEDCLSDTTLRESFIRRAYLLDNWQGFLREQLTVNTLETFHNKHVLNQMNTSQKETQCLNKLLNDINQDNIQEISHAYIRKVMDFFT